MGTRWHALIAMDRVRNEGVRGSNPLSSTQVRGQMDSDTQRPVGDIWETTPPPGAVRGRDAASMGSARSGTEWPGCWRRLATPGPRLFGEDGHPVVR
jgi:hypothetical protein